jgi:hypothetical protein
LRASAACEFDADPPAEGVAGDMHSRQAQSVELLFDAVDQRLNRWRYAGIQWRSAGVAMQGRHNHFVVWFQIRQDRGPRLPDRPYSMQ